MVSTVFSCPARTTLLQVYGSRKEKKKNRKKVLLTALSYGSVYSFFHCFLHHKPSAAAGIFLYGSLCKDARFYAESFPRLIFPRGYS